MRLKPNFYVKSKEIDLVNAGGVQPPHIMDDVSYRYLIPVNANSLHPFKSRGFGGEIGLVAVNYQNIFLETDCYAFFLILVQHAARIFSFNLR